jgi:polysaccharide biosynthesis/export protein
VRFSHTVKALFLSLATLLSLHVGCGGQRHHDHPYAKEYDPRKHEYVIGASDNLNIVVWQNGDLSTQALVRPDGTITMPLIGDLQVAGRTPTQVRDDITKRISQYVKAEAAIVTVAVTEVNSYRFTVTGAVTNPGNFSSSHYVTVADAIAMAGGTTRFADRHNIELLRIDENGKTRRVPIDFEDIETRRRPEANLVLVAGDTIHVP